MTQSKTVYARLAAVQAKCSAITKASKGHGYSYANLADTIAMLQPLLGEEGLSVVTTVVRLEDGEREAVATVRGPDGEGVTVSLPVPEPKDMKNRGTNDMQAMGSIISYARRYALSCLFNLATEDDDGASAKESSFKRPTQSKAVHPPRTSTAEADRALKMIQSATSDTELEVAAAYIKSNVPEDHKANLVPIYQAKLAEVQAS